MSDLPILDELGAAVSQASRRADRRARRRRFGAAVCALLACVVAVDAGLSASPGGRSLAERAYAAVAAGAGLRHLVYEGETIRRDGRRVAQRTETWMTHDGCRGRTRFLRSAEVVGEVSEDASSRRQFDARRRRLYVSRRERGDLWEINDPVEAFRELYRRGRLRQTARTEAADRELVRFVLVDGDTTITYLADARSFLPVEMTLADDGGRTSHRTRFVRYERLPATPRTLALLDLPDRRGVAVRRVDLLGGAGGPRRMQRLHCYG